jgi:hypothetical protein
MSLIFETSKSLFCLELAYAIKAKRHIVKKAGKNTLRKEFMA